MWEKTFEKSKDTAYRISSKFLKEAFQWVKGFIAEDVESERPEISVAESRGGTLAATNGLVLASVNSPIFEKLKLRIHGKDFSTLQKYMSFCKGEPVTVYHCEDAMFFEKEDGTLYFLQKPPTPMEEYTFDDENHFEVSFDKKDFMSAVKSLSAAIDRDKKTLCISFPEENVLSISDGTKKNTMKITCALESFTESHEDFLKTGFHFNYPYLMKMLALSSEDLQKMGIVIKERNDQIVGGMLNLKEKRDSKEGGIVEYTADMVWRIL
jgi:DNA polymerase III sliding clamp (beta) subunit (PCNA family)